LADTLVFGPRASGAHCCFPRDLQQAAQERRAPLEFELSRAVKNPHFSQIFSESHINVRYQFSVKSQPKSPEIKLREELRNTET